MVRVVAQAVAAHREVDGFERHLGVQLTRLAVGVDAVVVVYSVGDVA